MTITRSLALPLSIGLAGAALLAGCGGYSLAGDSPTTTLSATAALPEASATPAGATPTSSATGAKLSAVSDPKLGLIVTDASGFTLYRFDKDTPKPSTSDCFDDCEATWPPAITTGDVDVDGIDRSLVGTITRPDGSRQITLAGWPAYLFAGDSEAGDTTGQGVGGVWFALTPEGKKAGAPAGGAAKAPASTTSSTKAATKPSTTRQAYAAY